MIDLTTDKNLKIVSDLANRQLDLQLQIAQAEANVVLLKETLKEVSQVDLPEAMSACGCSSISLENGAKVFIKVFYQGKISEGNQEKAFSWLRERGHGDIIKNTVTIAYGKDEDEEAEQLKHALKNKGRAYVDKIQVHPMTLKAFIREQTETGRPLPQDLFGIFIGRQAIIKE